MQGTEIKKNQKAYVKLPMYGIPKLIPFLKKYKKLILTMLFGGLIGSMIDIINPLFQRYAIDHFIGMQTLDGLPVFIVCFFVFLLCQAAFTFIAHYASSRVELFINRDLRSMAFSHLQTLSFSYFNQNSVGYVHARVMSDTGRIGELVSWSMMDGTWNITYMVGAIIVMFTLRWQLAVLVIAVIPLAALLIILFQGKLIAVNREIREKNSKITGNFNEGITGAKTIKTLVIENKMDREFREDTAAMRKLSVRAQHYRAMFWATISFCSFLALSLVLWRGGILHLEQVIELGTLSVFMNYALGIMEPILWVVDAISNLITAQVNIERLTGLLDTVPDVADSKEVQDIYGDTFQAKRKNWEPLHGDIEFADVSFKYPDGEEYVLSNFNLKIPAGTNVAIVGETGAGKSTLVNLVCRFFEPTSGKVLIDGRDARERSQLWLHSNIGYVLQTPHLFSGTIRENLLYGNETASEEQIWDALQRVSADTVVSRMEKGLDSDVGEGGDLLSTGEKQLISFARAILADPRILVLDEATASIDTVTEQLIQNAIGDVIAGRTSFVIAHRLSTIRNADVILVVKDGKIIEQGTHAELLQKKQYYYKLYSRQYEEDMIDRVMV